MTTSAPTSPDVADFVARIDGATAADDRLKICDEVKSILEDIVARELQGIPGRFFRGTPDHYARRLLHECPDQTYSIIVMVWQPGQSTAIHDHASNWCVECVLAGNIEVVTFDPVGDPARACRFTEVARTVAGPGDVGILIPPNEYHSIANVSQEEAVTIHIYEGEMLWCNTFSETGDGTYRGERCDLSYTE